MAKERYRVDGMSCAACVAHVEQAVRGVNGVDDVSVSLLTNSMDVEGEADAAEVCKAVSDAGYAAAKQGGEKEKSFSGTVVSEEDLEDRETPKLMKRLTASLVFLVPMMYLTMGSHMLGLPLPAVVGENPVGKGLIELLIAVIVMLINRAFFISGIKSAMHLAPNMDTLVAMGSGVSFIYSFYALFMMSWYQSVGMGERVMYYADRLYFETAAMIVALITVGKTLESYSKGKTTSAISDLIRLAPKYASVVRDGKEEKIPVQDLAVGDVFLVRPGEAVPIDGVITEGDSAVDESVMTGESVPADKTVGDEVYMGTMNTSGFLTCRATKVGEDTSLAQIIRMVSEAAASKAPIAKTADQVAAVFVPAVLVVAVITALIWLIAGGGPAYALEHAVAVLVISCPCALGLATPVAIMVGSGVGAKHGILFKTATALETAGRADVVVLDKTGTITSGDPGVTDVVPMDGVSEETLLYSAAMTEAGSEHPLAKAVMEYVRSRKITCVKPESFEAVAGNGVRAVCEGVTFHAGKDLYIRELLSKNRKSDSDKKKVIHDAEDFDRFVRGKRIEALKEMGKTPLFFEGAGQLLGAIAVSDTIRPESGQAIAEIKAMGLDVVMLTGDNERTARSIGKTAGVDAVIAGVMPDGKEREVRYLMEDGDVIMVGDGVNDAPALVAASTGFAIGAGTDIAIDAADVVLKNASLRDVPAAIRLSKGVMRNIKQNLFWAFFYNVIGIPLAAGLWYPIFGIDLNPMFGAAAMSLSSFCVVMNALRLNLFDIYESKAFNKKREKVKVSGIRKAKDKPETQKAPEEAGAVEEQTKTEEESMEKHLKIEGMMCEHCQARVKKALEEIEGVQSAEVSHEKDMADVKLSAEVSEETFKAAIEDAGYTLVTD